MQTTSAAELLANKTKTGQAIGKLIASTPYVPPASVTVPASSTPQVPPVPTGPKEA